MRVYPREAFEDSIDYQDALLKFKKEELFQCSRCGHYFDEETDLQEGVCKTCLPFIIYEEGGD